MACILTHCRGLMKICPLMQGMRKTLESRPLQLDWLRTFALVLETGGFSAAAERLGLTQPAVSLQIRQLERSLGVRLIERVGRRAAATPAGAELLGHVAQIEGAVDGAVQAVSRHAGEARGRVRLGTGATACLHFLPVVLRSLHERHPALSVVVGTGNTADQVRRVEENTLDLALVTLPVAGRALAVTPVLRDELVLISPPQARARQVVPATPERLGALPLVLFEPGGHTRQLIDAWFLAARMAVRPVMELGSVEAIKEMVAAGLGHGIVPSMSLGARGPAGLRVQSLRPRLQRELGLVVRRDKPMGKALQQVCEAIAGAAHPRRTP